jgi:preprotein translocase subunit YajC
MFFIPFLLAAPASGSGAAGGQGGMMSMIVPLALIMLIFYMFMIRPQNKKQKETERMLAELKKGDKVITIGGIHGTISSTKEKTVIVKVDDDTKIEFNRNAISTVVVDKPASPVPAAVEKPKFSLFGFAKKKEAVSESDPAPSDSAAPNP